MRSAGAHDERVPRLIAEPRQEPRIRPAAGRTGIITQYQVISLVQKVLRAGRGVWPSEGNVHVLKKVIIAAVAAVVAMLAVGVVAYADPTGDLAQALQAHS